MAKKTRRSSSGGRANTAGATREQAAVVRRYLEALQQHKPRRGRKRTPESIRKRMKDIEGRIEQAAPLQRLQLVQERMDLEQQLQSLQAQSEISKYEGRFVEVARRYGDTKGITYGAWRELGVPPETLRKAGIPRTRRASASR